MDRELTAELRRTLGDDAVVTEPAALAPYLREWRGHYPGRGVVAVRPADTAAVAAAVAACRRHGAAVVPQSGNTGLVGGASPRERSEVVVSLERLTRIRAVDAADATLVAEAGCRLADVQAAAREAGRLFPLSLPSEGECRLGGNLATNAGGTNVLRYGNARALTLGLEVVLPDGRVWDGLRALRKDNSGYDLRDLFIGAEGTLGIITAAVLRLFPAVRRSAAAFAALPSAEAAVALLGRLQAECGESLSGCELMSARAVAFACDAEPQLRNPLQAAPWYLLAELTSADPHWDLDGALERALAGGTAAGEVTGVHQPADAAGARALWALRDAVPAGQSAQGASIKHDVSVPVSAIPAFLEEASAAVLERHPGARLCPFGHVGDGNIHFNVSQPEGAEPAAFLARWEEISDAVHEVVARLGGSIAAEHGVGQLKRAELARRKPAVELELMRRIKAALDPDGLMNPGKVLPP